MGDMDVCGGRFALLLRPSYVIVRCGVGEDCGLAHAPSIDEMTSDDREFGLITPGQCAKPASRIPPSHVEPLPTFQ